MYYFYNYTPEKRNSWRNAQEIKAAAIEHEKWRLQREDVAPMAKPQTITKRKKLGR